MRLVRRAKDKEQMAENIERGKDAPVQKIISFKTGYGDLKVRMITSYWASRLKVWVSRSQDLQRASASAA